MKKPEPKKMEYYDWFDVEKYMYHLGIEDMDELRCYLHERNSVGNDSYMTMPKPDPKFDSDEKWYNVAVKVFEEFGNKEKDEPITFWISW